MIKRSTARRLAPVAILAAICGIAVVFTVVLEQVVLAQSAFKLERLRKNLAVAEARHEGLLLQAAQLASPARIERYARHELGMVDPARVEYIVADVSRPDRRLASWPSPRVPAGNGIAANVVGDGGP